MAALARACAALVAAPVAAVVTATSKETFIVKLRDWIYYKLARMLGGEQFVWPPSRKSTPFLAGTWIILGVVIIYLVRERKNNAINEITDMRREYALGSLDNLLGNEKMRVQEVAQKKADLKALGLPESRFKFMTRKEIKQIADERKAAAKAKAFAERQSAREAAGEPLVQSDDEDEKDDEEARKTADEKAADEADDKVEPPAQKLFQLVFDEVEGMPITTIGVAEDDPRLLEGMKLLRKRCTEQLEEALEKTDLARKYHAGVPLDIAADVPRDLHHYYDGDRLVKLTRWMRYEVKKKMKYKHKEFDKPSVKALDTLIKKCMRRWKQIGQDNRNAQMKIWALLKPWKVQYLCGMILRMFSQVSWGFWYGSIVALPGEIMENSVDPLQEAARKCLLQFVWFLFNWPLDNIANTAINNTQAYFTLGLRDAVMESILRQDREYFDFHHAGVLQERLNHDTGMLAHHIIRQPADFTAMLSHVISKTIYMYTLSPHLFFVSLSVPIPLTLILCFFSIEYLRKLHRKIRRVHEVSAAGSIDVLREITTVRQFAMEDKEESRYETVNLFRRILERRLSTIDRFTWGIIGVGFWGTQILLTWIGLRMILLPRLPGVAAPMSVSQLTVICVNMHDIVWASRYAIELIPELMKLEEPIQRVAQTLGTIPRIEDHPDNPLSEGKLKPTNFMGHLQFDNVHFTYPTEKQKPVLKGFSFEVKPGQKVACVGRAGCGKSTSVGLLQRLYDPDIGTIKIDGRPIGDYNVHYLRRCTGIVAQDNVLFATSIRENICYGMGQGHLPMPSLKEVWDICDKANAREFIEIFPNQLNTRVGERGIKLSGGQRQRIAVARAMIRKPCILLLDEATSALDPVNEKIVQRALDNLMQEHNGVAIVIAHRLTTIKNCDNIVMMDKGLKVEEGTHTELMKIQVKKNHLNEATQGYYHNQWDTQMGEETFGEPSHMNDEQLGQKVIYWTEQVTEIQKESRKRKKAQGIEEPKVTAG